MSFAHRMARVLLGAALVAVPIGGVTANADPADPGTPTNHTEWLDRLFAADVTEQGGFTQIYASSESSCGIEIDQTVTCWGGNYEAESLTSKPTGAFISLGTSATDTCGIRADESISCWGSGYIDPPAGSYKAVSVVDNSWDGCALTSNGEIECWGPSAGEWNTSVPTGTFISIDLDAYGGCALSTSNMIECWGQNAEPGAIQEDEFKQFSINRTAACGITIDDTLACWGTYDDYFGPQGQGPLAEPPDSNYSKVSLGLVDACALGADGSIDCWSYGGGEAELLSDPPAGTFTDVAVGDGHGCAVATTHIVKCWGEDSFRATRAPDVRTIADAGVVDYVRDLESQRDRLQIAPVCDIRTPQTRGRATPATAKTISGTVRWQGQKENLSNHSAWVELTISRQRNDGLTEYWRYQRPWTTTPSSRIVFPTEVDDGWLEDDIFGYERSERPWSLQIKVPDTKRATYTISCTAIDNLGNRSATPDVSQMTTIKF